MSFSNCGFRQSGKRRVCDGCPLQISVVDETNSNDPESSYRRATPLVSRACNFHPDSSAPRNRRATNDHSNRQSHKQAAASRPRPPDIDSAYESSSEEEENKHQINISAVDQHAILAPGSRLPKSSSKHTPSVLESRPNESKACQPSFYYEAFNKDVKTIQQASPLDEAIKRMEEEYLKNFGLSTAISKQSPQDQLSDQRRAGHECIAHLAHEAPPSKQAEDLDSSFEDEAQIDFGKEPNDLPKDMISDDDSKDLKMPRDEIFQDSVAVPQPGSEGSSNENAISNALGLKSENPNTPRKEDVWDTIGDNICFDNRWPTPELDHVNRRGRKDTVKTRAWRKKEGKMYKMRKHLIAMVEDEQALYFRRAPLGHVTGRCWN